MKIISLKKREAIKDITYYTINKLLKKSELEATIIELLAIKLHILIYIYKIPKFLNRFNSIQRYIPNDILDSRHQAVKPFT